MNPRTEQAHAMAVQSTDSPVEALADMVKFADELETELAEAKRKLAMLECQVGVQIGLNNALKTSRDKWRGVAHMFASATMHNQAMGAFTALKQEEK